jgi:toxin ParE1/3/4
VAFAVKLANRAMRDLAELFDELYAGDSSSALRWYRGLRQPILTLSEHPNRCSRVPEAARLRQLLYGRKPHVYRIIFRVMERQKLVEVLHIRHGARKSILPEEIL